MSQILHNVNKKKVKFSEYHFGIRKTALVQYLLGNSLWQFSIALR